MKLKRLGIDLAKNVYQVHGVDDNEQVRVRKSFSRTQLRRFLAGLEPALIGMEACGGSHYWGRELTAMGHDVKLIPPQFVKPYVKRHKNDAVDAEAICEAISRPTMRFVTIKSADQQAMQLVHRVRSRIVKARTALVNELRGMLAEFGIMIGAMGVSAVRRAIPALLEDADNGLTHSMRELLHSLYHELKDMDDRLENMKCFIKVLACTLLLSASAVYAQDIAVLLPVTGPLTPNEKTELTRTAVDGLAKKFELKHGEAVDQFVKQAFQEESKKTDCDETNCYRKIAAQYHAEKIIALRVVMVNDGYYLLTLSIYDIAPAIWQSRA